MGNILHANAKTTPRIKTEIQNATASIAVLAERYKLNPKTIIRWKNTLSVADKKSGPKVCNGLINLDTFQATFLILVFHMPCNLFGLFKSQDLSSFF